MKIKSIIKRHTTTKFRVGTGLYVLAFRFGLIQIPALCNQPVYQLFEAIFLQAFAN